MNEPPTIDAYEFGRIVVGGQAYTADVILLPTGIRANWWRDEGHVLKPRDLDAVMEARPDVLVVGTGASGAMRVTNETMTYLQQAGIDAVCLPTTQAVTAYNEEVERGEAVAAALHLAAASPNFLICEYHPALTALGNDLLASPLAPVDGLLAVPDAPGLGVEFDEEALTSVIKASRRIACDEDG